MRSLLSATVGVSQLREMVMAGRLLLDSRISTPNIALSSAKTRSQLAKSELPGFLLGKRWVSAPVSRRWARFPAKLLETCFFKPPKFPKKLLETLSQGKPWRNPEPEWLANSR